MEPDTTVSSREAASGALGNQAGGARRPTGVHLRPALAFALLVSAAAGCGSSASPAVEAAATSSTEAAAAPSSSSSSSSSSSTELAASPSASSSSTTKVSTTKAAAPSDCLEQPAAAPPKGGWVPAGSEPAWVDAQGDDRAETSILTKLRAVGPTVVPGSGWSESSSHAVGRAGCTTFAALVLTNADGKVVSFQRKQLRRPVGEAAFPHVASLRVERADDGSVALLDGDQPSYHSVVLVSAGGTQLQVIAHGAKAPSTGGWPTTMYARGPFDDAPFSLAEVREMATKAAAAL